MAERLRHRRRAGPVGLLLGQGHVGAVVAGEHRHGVVDGEGHRDQAAGFGGEGGLELDLVDVAGCGGAGGEGGGGGGGGGCCCEGEEGCEEVEGHCFGAVVQREGCLFEGDDTLVV